MKFDMSERALELLRDLAAFSRSAAKHPDWHPQWARPLDLGGSSGSHHSATLARFVKAGLVERKRRGSLGGRGAYVYRITDRGRETLALIDSLR